MKNIYKKYYITVLLLFLISCGKYNELQPQLELVNKEVFYVEKEIDYFYSYDNAEQRIKATNLITYKISNPTDKKVLFVIDNFLWSPMNGAIDNKELGILFIAKNNVVNAEMGTVLFNDTSEVFNLAAENYFYNDSIKKMKYELMGIYHKGFPLENLDKIDRYINNAVILNPMETRTFYTLLKLPIIDEVNLKIGHHAPFFIDQMNKFDKFQLYYSADAEYLKSILPEFLLKELEDNQIEIFDGILMSNEVPLVKR